MISIIIPTLNEARALPTLLQYLGNVQDVHLITEIIISDGKSTDRTVEIGRDSGAKVITNQSACRALQMNAGATVAQGEILYFLHADSYPPKDFLQQIMRAVNNGADAGCFRLSFDHDHWFLKLNAWFTRFSFTEFRFGDQSLFIKKNVFKAVGRFNEKQMLLEDQEIIRRIKIDHKFKVVPHYITTSARKYLQYGIVNLQCIYFYIYFLYRLGYSQQRLLERYKRFTHQL